MADPTIQTFCCHQSRNGTDMANLVISEFNTTSYNILCLCSSVCGILGALYQILPREENRQFGNRGRQIIVYLAIADLFASLGVMIRSIMWINFKAMVPEEDDLYNALFCSLTSAWTQYFYTATWLWTLCYAIDTHLLLRERDSHMLTYHTVSWGIPGALTGTGMAILYYPNANCHDLTSLKGALLKVLPNYCATYIPITVVLICNPIIYYISSKNIENAVARPFSQITSKERNMMDTLKLKFALINLCFYLCWLPNIVNGILLWTLWYELPIDVIIVVWYIMALMNPLQALFNALVYRRWTRGAQRLKLTFIPNWMRRKTAEPLVAGERAPLLGPRPPSRLRLTDNSNNVHSSSINGFSSL